MHNIGWFRCLHLTEIQNLYIWQISILNTQQGCRNLICPLNIKGPCLIFMNKWPITFRSLHSKLGSIEGMAALHLLAILSMTWHEDRMKLVLAQESVVTWTTVASWWYTLCWVGYVCGPSHTHRLSPVQTVKIKGNECVQRESGLYSTCCPYSLTCTLPAKDLSRVLHMYSWVNLKSGHVQSLFCGAPDFME